LERTGSPKSSFETPDATGAKTYSFAASHPYSGFADFGVAVRYSIALQTRSSKRRFTRMSSKLQLLTTAEMTRADLRAVELGVPSLTLMENAGRAVADEAMKMVPLGARIAVLCGPGNNGGDGFVAARLLREAGFVVDVGLLGQLDGLRGDAAAMAKRWTGPVAEGDEFLEMSFQHTALFVDALFGAGLSRPLSEDLAANLLTRISDDDPVLAVDVPSGLNGNTGDVGGPFFSATRTVTFFRRKPGHLLLPGRLLCGEVILADIGIPDEVLDPAPHLREDGVYVEPPNSWEPIGLHTFANSPDLWRAYLPRIRADGHKYTRGHAVIVSGGIEMSGAARLSARGALRMGAGLVTVATPPDALLAHASQLSAVLLKRTDAATDLSALLHDKRFNAVAIGPGLGRDTGTFAKIEAVLASNAAVALDADAITIAAASPECLFKSIASRPQPVVLTPHEGEFKRLFPEATGSKLDRARHAACMSGGVVVLKGADTVIAAPDRRAAINENAPSTLATAGSGDVLTGFVTGLLAQGMPAFEAACAAVWLHGECANHFGPGLIAEDIPEALPAVLRKVLVS